MRLDNTSTINDVDLDFLKDCQALYGDPGQMDRYDVEHIYPLSKDKSRASGLKNTGRRIRDNGEPFSGKARTMAKAIGDATKLVRRAKAVVDLYGTYDYENVHEKTGKTEIDNVWVPFATALKAMGFSEVQIEEIKRYKS